MFESCRGHQPNREGRSAMGYADPDQQREYQREWRKQRRQAWLKANGPCRTCGSWDDLEVDHVDPATKSVEPRELWSRTASVQAAELAKCQPLCSTCHGEKTRQQNRRPLPAHGTRARFVRRPGGCRCAACRAANAEYRADLRARRRAAA